MRKRRVHSNYYIILDNIYIIIVFRSKRKCEKGFFFLQQTISLIFWFVLVIHKKKNISSLKGIKFFLWFSVVTLVVYVLYILRLNKSIISIHIIVTFLHFLHAHYTFNKCSLYSCSYFSVLWQNFVWSNLNLHIFLSSRYTILYMIRSNVFIEKLQYLYLYVATYISMTKANFQFSLIKGSTAYIGTQYIIKFFRKNFANRTQYTNMV